MKGVKMAGLTEKLTEIIQSLRVAEVMSGYKFRTMTVWNLIIGKSTFRFTFDSIPGPQANCPSIRSSPH
jgi:hypothetical protein